MILSIPAIGGAPREMRWRSCARSWVFLMLGRPCHSLESIESVFAVGELRKSFRRRKIVFAWAMGLSLLLPEYAASPAPQKLPADSPQTRREPSLPRTGPPPHRMRLAVARAGSGYCAHRSPRNG